MSKVVVVIVFLISCGSLNQGQPADARISPDVEIQDALVDAKVSDAPLDVEILDSPIDSIINIDSMISDAPTDVQIIDASMDAEVFDATPDSGIDTSATCVSRATFFGRNAQIATNILCQIPQTVSITTEIFENNVSLDSIRQGGLGCGSFAGFILNETNGFPNRATIILHVENTDIFKDCVQN